MDIERAAFMYWRTVKRVVGFGDIDLVVKDNGHGEEVIRIECRFNTAKGPYGVNVALPVWELRRMPEEGVLYRATADGERIRMQLVDKDIGVVARNA